MEEFKKKLDVLLAEFPDLPEFTIHVQPRVKLIIKEEVNPLLPNHGVSIQVPNSPMITPERIRELSKQTSLGL